MNGAGEKTMNKKIEKVEAEGQTLEIEVYSEEILSPEWTAEVLRVHPVTARGVVGTLNNGWQVWEVKEGQLHCTIYLVRRTKDQSISRTCAPVLLARKHFGQGKLRARKGYAQSYDVV